MATAHAYLAQLGRSCLSSSLRARPQLPVSFLFPATQLRYASAKSVGTKGQNPQKNKKKGEAPKKKKKARTSYKQYDDKDAESFYLLDAMRYIRAFEVGRSPTSVKYEVALKLKSPKNGPVVRNRMRLPHPVKTDLRICVIAPPDSKFAEDARAAGATLVGEEDVFEAVKDGRIEFDRCLCQVESLPKMTKAGLGRVLGPKGLMPSAKLGTVVKNPAAIVKELVGGAEYREKLGVIRMSIGQLGFTPEEMQRNIKSFMDHIKKDLAAMSDKMSKDIAEVVLSSTNAPGFILNGEFKSPTSDITSRDLSNA